MKPAPLIAGACLLTLMAALAFFLSYQQSHQRLDAPGVKFVSHPGQMRGEIILPDSVPGYKSFILTNNETVLENYLPQDTSFRIRAYSGTNGLFCEMSVVVMGNDRSSIHNPEICMPSQGWDIENQFTTVEKVPMTRPFPYQLTVNRIITTKSVTGTDGQPHPVNGVYVYWFVDNLNITAKSWKWKIWYIPRDLVMKGTLDRWAYISLFASCDPGQENATFGLMKEFLRTAVPEFQVVPKAPPGRLTAP